MGCASVRCRASPRALRLRYRGRACLWSSLQGSRVSLACFSTVTISCRPHEDGGTPTPARCRPAGAMGAAGTRGAPSRLIFETRCRCERQTRCAAVATQPIRRRRPTAASRESRTRGARPRAGAYRAPPRGCAYFLAGQRVRAANGKWSRLGLLSARAASSRSASSWARVRRPPRVRRSWRWRRSGGVGSQAFSQ